MIHLYCEVSHQSRCELTSQRVFHAATHLPSLLRFAWHNGELSSFAVGRLARRMCFTRWCVFGDAGSSVSRRRERTCNAGMVLRVGGTYVFDSVQCPAATRQGDGKQCEHTLLTPRPVLAHCATRCASARGVHPHPCTHLPSFYPIPFLFTPHFILLTPFKVRLMSFPVIK